MTPSDPDLRIGPLDQSHRDQLAAFSCANYRMPHTAVVEELVRERLTAERTTDRALKAVGAWTASLDGLAVWRIESGDVTICRSILLAVRNGARKRGLGSLLKRTVIDAARAAGAIAVVSHVHWDNDPMLNLNIRFGANIERIPGDRDYARCTIPVHDIVKDDHESPS